MYSVVQTKNNQYSLSGKGNHMKIFAILTTLIMAITASAANSGMVTLDSVTIDGEQTPYVGQLTVDDVNNNLTLRIYDDTCGALKPADGKARCMAMAGLVMELSVPVTERSFPCGSTQISGYKDLSPVDGPRIEIVYVNHSTRLCRDIVANLITVEASTFNPWSGKTTQYSLKTKK